MCFFKCDKTNDISSIKIDLVKYNIVSCYYKNVVNNCDNLIQQKISNCETLLKIF